MPFSFYQAPNAPAPDWGALVQANLGRQAQEQNAIQALMQAAGERQRLIAAKQAQDANRAIDQGNLDARNSEIQLGREKLSQQSDADQEAQSRFEDQQAGLNNREMLSQFMQTLRTRMQQEGATQRDMAQQKRLADEAAAKRAEDEAVQKQFKAYGDRLVAARGTFTPRDFTAGEALVPGFLTNPAGAYQQVLKAYNGDHEKAQEVMKLLASTKHKVSIAPKDWYSGIAQEFSTLPVGEKYRGMVDQIASVILGEDPGSIPTAEGDAHLQAAKYFSQFPQFEGLVKSYGQKPVDPTEALRKEAGLRLREEAGMRAKLSTAYMNARRASGDMQWDYTFTDAQRQEAIDKELQKLEAGGSTEKPAAETPKGSQMSDADMLDAIFAEHPEMTPEQAVEEMNKRRGK